MKFKVTLTNDTMPFADDASYDVSLKTFFTMSFDTLKEGRKFFRKFAKENNMIVFRNEAYSNGRLLNCNF